MHAIIRTDDRRKEKQSDSIIIIDFCNPPGYHAMINILRTCGKTCLYNDVNQAIILDVRMPLICLLICDEYDLIFIFFQGISF